MDSDITEKRPSHPVIEVDDEDPGMINIYCMHLKNVEHCYILWNEYLLFYRGIYLAK